jgi:Calx-beta domain
MSNREAGPAAAARGRAWRPGHAGAALALLLAGFTGAPGEVRADTFVLKGGEVVDGAIVDATRNTVVIRRTIGGMRQARLADIEEVRLELAQGQAISGQFLGWADGVYQVRSGNQTLRIAEGDILSREPGGQATARPAQAAQPARPAGERSVRMAAAPAAPAENPAAEAPSGRAEETSARPAEDANLGPASGDDQNQAALENASPAAGASESLAVKASVEPAAPGADNMVFRIELSRPAEQTVVLIYGTVDDTAKAGTDYEPQQGMMTLAPGTRSAEVQVPLVADRPGGGEKRFALFLTADPKVAEVVDPRIVATIDGKD